MYKFRGKSIPERMMPSIKRYVEHGVIPGDFLQAIICNDLRESFMRADDENMENIPAYVSYFYNEVPGNCCGSHERMIEWADQLGKSGIEMQLSDKNLKSTTISEEFEIARAEHENHRIKTMEKRNGQNRQKI